MNTPLYVTTTYYGAKKTGPVVKVTPTTVTLKIEIGRGRHHHRVQEFTKHIDAVHPWTHKDLDALTNELTAFSTFRELLSDTVPTYRPTLRNTGLWRLLANAYDLAQQRAGDPRRAFRMSR